MCGINHKANPPPLFKRKSHASWHHQWLLMFSQTTQTQPTKALMLTTTANCFSLCSTLPQRTWSYSSLTPEWASTDPNPTAASHACRMNRPRDSMFTWVTWASTSSPRPLSSTSWTSLKRLAALEWSSFKIETTDKRINSKSFSRCLTLRELAKEAWKKSCTQRNWRNALKPMPSTEWTSTDYEISLQARCFHTNYYQQILSDPFSSQNEWMLVDECARECLWVKTDMMPSVEYADQGIYRDMPMPEGLNSNSFSHS